MFSDEPDTVMRSTYDSFHVLKILSFDANIRKSEGTQSVRIMSPVSHIQICNSNWRRDKLSEMRDKITFDLLKSPLRNLSS